MSSRQKVLWFLAGLFGVLTVVCFFASVKELDRDSARYLGIDRVANTQMTVFTGACAVLCGVYVASAIIVGAFEEEKAHGGGSGEMANEVVKAIRQNEIDEKRKQEEDEKARIEQEKLAQEEELKNRERLRIIEELKTKQENGEEIENNIFLEEIKGATSMMDIWNIWKKYNLNEKYPEVDAYITKHKDLERVYGKSRYMDHKIQQIENMLKV